MKVNMNGNTKVWATRISIAAFALTVIGMLYSQTVDKGRMLKTVETVEEKNTAMEIRIEKRDVKFDTFLIQQTKKNTIDSINTIVLMRYIDVQVRINEQQIILNNEVKVHLIKADND